jgi:hypothetical protein
VGETRSIQGDASETLDHCPFFTVFSEGMSILSGPHRLYTEGCP